MTAAGDIDFTYDDALARHDEEDYETLRSSSDDIRFYRELARASGGSEPFALVYSAFRSFQHLDSREQKVAALREMKRVLAPHGTLAFDVFDDCPKRAAARVEEQNDYRLEDDGQIRERRSSARLLPDEHLIRVRFRWLTDGEETERTDFHMAITTRDEIDGLLEEAGLRLHALHADFGGAAWSADDPRELVVLARHA